MSSWYIDGSAAVKMLADEPESPALREALIADDPAIVACLLLETELRRVAERDTPLTQQRVTDFLEGIVLYDLPRRLFRAARLIPGPDLRSLGAIHVAAASVSGVDAVVTYDRRMTDAARGQGLVVLAPGA